MRMSRYCTYGTNIRNCLSDTSHIQAITYEQTYKCSYKVRNEKLLTV